MFVIQEARVGVPQIAAVSDWAVVPTGTRVKAVDPTFGEGEFIFLKGVVGTAVGSAVLYNAADHTTALLGANAIGPVAFAMSAAGAGKFGWYQIYGKAASKVLTGYADNGRAFATATAGSLDDAVVDGDMVHNCLGASAIDGAGTGLAYMEIAYPYCDDILTND